MLVAVSVPAGNDRSPLYAEQALAAIHQANPRRLPATLLFARHDDRVGLYCRFPVPLKSAFLHQLAAAYPDARIERLSEDALAPPAEWQTWIAELRLRPDLFPIRRHVQYEDAMQRDVADPLTGILAALASDCLHSQIELHIGPAARWRRHYARHVVDRLARPFFRNHSFLSELYARATMSRWLLPPFLAWLASGAISKPSRSVAENIEASTGRLHDRGDRIQAGCQKVGRHLFDVRLRLIVSASAGSRRQALAKLQEVAGAFGQFTSPHWSTFRLGQVRNQTAIKPLSNRRGFLLSDEELATLWHPATGRVRAETMSTNNWRELEPPPLLASSKREPEVAELGRVKFRRRNERFGIALADRRRHLAIMGKTGMGKSTLLERLIASDIDAGRGVCLIDPHGDLAEAVLRTIPKRRTNDVVLLDAGDQAFPLAYNPLDAGRRNAEQRPLVAAAVVSAFKKLYGDSWGPRLEHILRNAVLALLEVPGTSLVSLQRMLSDGRYRKEIIRQLDDPLVKNFWQNEFGSWNERFRSEAVAPIQNKVGQFLANPILRAIVGQERSKLDLRLVMDEGQILIANLSKGRSSDDAAALLGSLLVTSIQQAAMSRADVPEADRRDFFLYVDEFQNFATESFCSILSEARKYRLSITTANQFIDQVEEKTLAALFGNVGSLLSFQVGSSDAEILAEQLAGDLTPEDLLALPQFTAYVRLLIEGMPSKPFSIQTLPPRNEQRHENRADVVRRTSRRRYTRPAGQVHREVSKAFAMV